MAESEETRIALARIEGMLSATLPHHSAKLDEHDKLILALSAAQTQQGQDIAGITAVMSERIRPPNWVSVAGMLTGIGALILTIIVIVKG